MNFIQRGFQSPSPKKLSPANALAHEGTVVIQLHHAHAALRAVNRPRWPLDLTPTAHVRAGSTATTDTAGDANGLQNKASERIKRKGSNLSMRACLLARGIRKSYGGGSGKQGGLRGRRARIYARSVAF